MKLKPFISSLFLFSLVISIYISPIVEGFFKTTFLRPLFFLVAYATAFFYFAINFKKKHDKTFLFYVVTGLIIYLSSALIGSNFSGLKSYMGFLTAFMIIVIDYEKFLKYIKFIFIVCFFLALYEFFSKQFIYEVVRTVDGTLMALNEKFFGGHAAIFRAKGIFEGPLSLAQFAIAISIIFKDNLKIVLACLLVSVMSNVRLGILLNAILLLCYVIRKYSLVSFILSKKFLIGSVVVFGAVIFFMSKMKKNSIDRLLNVSNLNDVANLNRFHYWGEAISQYFDYNILSSLFGNLGQYRSAQGNSAENGWLMILLDTGLLGFLFYFVPILLLLLISLYKKTAHFMYIGLIFLAMMIQTFHSGASANVLFWIIIFTFYFELVKNKYRTTA